MGAIRPGSGGGSGGASALGDLSDIGTMGEPIGQADNLTEVVTALGGASAVRSAIGAGTSNGGLLLTTSHTYTRRNGSGTSAESSGQVTLSGTAGATFNGSNRPAAYASLPSGRTVAIYARVVSLTGDSNTYAGISLQNSAGTAENSLLLQAQPSGALQWGYESGGGYTGYSSVTPGSFTIDGTTWLKIEIDRAGRARFCYGKGSGSSPPAHGEWQQLGDHALSGWSGVGALAFDRVFLYAAQASAGAAAQAVFHNLYIETLTVS